MEGSGVLTNRGRRALKGAFFALLLAIPLLAPALPTSEAHAARKGNRAEERVLYTKNSLYQYLVVADDLQKEERYIYNSKRDYMQGGMSLKHPDALLFEYTRLSFIALAFLDRTPKKVLFVGLGAGSMPRWFHRYYPKAKVDAVEIDPEIFKIAKKYFSFREDERMKVHIMDGRRFIKRSREKYDMVFLDAYQTDYIPFHLTTVEFLKEVRRILADDGVVASNIVSERRNKYFYAMIKTYVEVFPHLYIYKALHSENNIFIAPAYGRKKKAEDIRARARQLEGEKSFDFDLPSLNDYYGYYTFFKMPPDTPLLTDDFAPVNLYRYMGVEENKGGRKAR
jgi:spermidine synthase